MGLRARFTKAALARPAVLLATSPGATRERLAVEAELGRRGWPQAAGPAAADLVVFAGAPVPVRGDDWAERVWAGVPAPKARVTVTGAEHAARALERGHGMLLAPAARLAGGRGTAAGADRGRRSSHDAEEHSAHGHGVEGPGGREGRAAGDEAHGGDDRHGESAGDGAHETHRHSPHGHGAMGHGGHARHPEVVAGLPLAERADDRDGLRLDRLHVPLGPALRDWPAGLVLRLELQGDVVQRAEVEPVSGPAVSRPAFWSEPWLRVLAGEPVTVGEAARRECAAHLDSLGRFLGVAGWSDAAVRARRARDRVLGGAGGEELRAVVRPWVRRVRRSRVLHWLTAGVGELSGGPAAGDAHSRLIGRLDAIERALGEIEERAPLAARPPTGPGDGAGAPAARELLAVLPALLEGAEFACARLVVASLDPDLDELVATGARGGRAHG